MKTNYRIEGMHCNGCVSKVLRALESMSDVTSAAVSLPNIALIESAAAIPAATLEQRLSGIGSYTVTEGGASIIDRLKPFSPLTVMFAVVLMWASIASYPWGHHAYHDWMRHFMGGFFLLFGGLKLVNLRSFSTMFRGYDLVAEHIPVWGYAYPFVEVGLGILYTLDLFAIPTNVVAAVVMAVGTIGIVLKLQSKTPQTCACLGGFFSVPLTWITVAENLLMAGMAIWMLLFH